MDAAQNHAIRALAVIQSELQQLLGLLHRFPGQDLHGTEIALGEGFKIHVLLCFCIETAVAGSTCHLSEFLTHTLCILVLFEGAWAEAIIVFQCFAHIVNELFVWIDVDFH